MEFRLVIKATLGRAGRVVVALAVALALLAPVGGCGGGPEGWTASGSHASQASGSAAGRSGSAPASSASFDYADVPEYAGEPSVTLNGDAPYFSDDDYGDAAGVSLSELDALGRAGAASAVVGPDTIATGARGSLKTEPSGFRIAKYDWVPGTYLFNRCHLVAHKLSGVGDEPRDLITGTRYLNVDGMQPCERAVQSFVERTGGEVLYRVTPVFLGDELVARGVLVEAASLADRGASFSRCEWCYNVQPGVGIDYASGENWADGTVGGDAGGEAEYRYLVNRKSKVFHLPDCPTGSTTKESNRVYSNDSREELIGQGYSPCGNCKP